MTYMMVIIVPTKFCFNYIRLKRTAKEVKMSSVSHEGNITKFPSPEGSHQKSSVNVHHGEIW